MIFRVEYSERAASDLADIIGYISDKLCNPQAAERFYNAVSEKLGLLREHPYMFPLRHDEKLSAEGVRFAVIGNYLIFYLVDDDNSVVSIARILYGRRNIPSIFEE
jgi:addiction module RelE/StbE family toxin